MLGHSFFFLNMTDTLLTSRGLDKTTSRTTPRPRSVSTISCTSMSSLPQTHCTTTEVDTDFLPSPATKLVVTQYLEASQDPPCWAWIVVGAFLDRHGRTVWSTEIFVAHLDVDLESDDEEAQSELSEDQDTSDSSSGSSYLLFLCCLLVSRHATARGE